MKGIFVIIVPLKKGGFFKMFHWKKLSCIALVTAALLTGCTKSNIVSPEAGTIAGDGKPNMEIEKDIEIDWDEVREDLRNEFLEPYGQFADYVMDLDVRYDDETDVLTVLLPVTHKTDAETAALYGQAVLSVIGEAVSTQNFYYEPPTENEEGMITSYGTFFDEHDVCVQVFPYDKEGDTSAYLVNDTMKAGEQRALEALAQ